MVVTYGEHDLPVIKYRNEPFQDVSHHNVSEASPPHSLPFNRALHLERLIVQGHVLVGEWTRVKPSNSILPPFLLRR